jgi:diguanylate cyclase (GGDEF)-like protein
MTRHEAIDAMRPAVAALANLTRQGDEPSLIRALFAGIEQIWPKTRCWLARVPPECYPSADDLFVMGDKTGLPVSLAVIGLQLKSRDSINQYVYEGRRYLLAHIAQPHSDDEDLLLVEVEDAFAEAELELFRDLLHVYKNHLACLASGDRDVLTGLPRRGSLLARVTEQIDARLSGRRYRAPGNADYLALLAPVGLRAVNAEHGHMAGDMLLRALAVALRDGLHEGDPLFRLGGKVFAALIYDLSEAEIAEVCARLHAASATAEVDGQRLDVAIGYASLSDHALPQDILESATRALRRAELGEPTCSAASLSTTDNTSGEADGKPIELF